ncbi:MAG: prepilin-type N-terminal cleavage/methylation domain-containing protein [Lachnospiraceae bacterium]|nr:prepilin-type N-terminal cleavage/methylation domain-containing protein [Lachnospiraceae bacterium]
MANLKETKLNNKGFSLVELIIVIAIMAVLIGVLAPQYLKYVEKSRVSTDRDNVTSIESALQVWAVDPDATSTFTNGETITLQRTGTAAATGAAADALTNAGMSTTPPNLTNKQTFPSVTITVNVNSTTGAVTITNNLP